MKTIAFALLTMAALSTASMAQGTHHLFSQTKDFGVIPSLELPGSIKRAKDHHENVLAFVYDPKGRYEYNGLLLQQFADLDTTKALIRKFVVVLLSTNNAGLKQYLDASDDQERPMYFLIDGDGKLVQKGPAPGDSRAGLATMQKIVSAAPTPAPTTSK